MDERVELDLDLVGVDGLLLRALRWLEDERRADGVNTDTSKSLEGATFSEYNLVLERDEETEDDTLGWGVRARLEGSGKSCLLTGLEEGKCESARPDDSANNGVRAI